MYIGKTSRKPAYRWKEHQTEHARRVNKLYSAMRKYGISSFGFEVVLTCRTEDDAYFCEELLISQAKQQNQKLYNLSEGGRAGVKLGSKLAEVTRKRMSAARKGRKNTDSHKERTRLAVINWWALASQNERARRIANMSKPRTKKISESARQKLALAVSRSWERDASRKAEAAKNCKSRHERGELGFSAPGEANPNAKFSLEVVKEIRKLRETEGLKHKELASRFGVSLAQVGRILRGESRRHE